MTSEIIKRLEGISSELSVILFSAVFCSEHIDRTALKELQEIYCKLKKVIENGRKEQ